MGMIFEIGGSLDMGMGLKNVVLEVGFEQYKVKSMVSLWCFLDEEEV